MDRLRLKFAGLIILIAVFLAGCGVAIPPFHPLEDRILRVIETSPLYGGEIGTDGKVVVRFSREIDPLSLSRKAMAVMCSADIPEGEALEDADISRLDQMEGLYQLSEDRLTVEFMPEGGFERKGEHDLIITKELRSHDGISFSGDSGGSGPFISLFYVDPGGSASGGGGVDGDGNDASSYGGGGGEEEEEDGGGDTGISPPPGPSYLVINEIYYDVDGADTNGDLFIELVGDAGLSLEGYYIALINGDDGKTYDTIPITAGSFIDDDGIFVIADTDSGGATKIADADLPENFDPQNGPDSIQLIGMGDELIDAVGYGPLPSAVAQNGLAMYEGAPAVDPPAGMSLSRLGGRTDTNDNSSDFVINTMPSPGSLDVTD